MAQLWDDSKLKGPGFNPRRRQEKLKIEKYLSLLFGSLQWSLQDITPEFDVLISIHVAINNHGYVVLIQIWRWHLMLNLIGWYKVDVLNWIVRAWSKLFKPDGFTWLDQDARPRKTIWTLKWFQLCSIQCLHTMQIKLECKNKLNNHPKKMATYKEINNSNI